MLDRTYRCEVLSARQHARRRVADAGYQFIHLGLLAEKDWILGEDTFEGE